MTKFQALFVLFLRHDTLGSCSWRALAAHYCNRYELETGKVKPFEERIVFNGLTFDGNQITGMQLEEMVFRILRNNRQSTEAIDLYEIDLNLIKANLKNHV